MFLIDDKIDILNGVAEREISSVPWQREIQVWLKNENKNKTESHKFYRHVFIVVQILS